MSTCTRRRTTLLGTVLLCLAFAVSACGGDAAEASDKPTRSTPTSTTPTSPGTPTATPTATPTLTPAEVPASPFEDRPQVRALRRWADAAARDVNARHHEFPLARAFQADTETVHREVAASWREDFGTYYPGPLPFTPIHVSGSRSQSTVTACVIGAGFALDRAGGQPAEKREVLSSLFTMAKQGGRWVLAGIAPSTADCAGVAVKGIRW